MARATKDSELWQNTNGIWYVQQPRVYTVLKESIVEAVLGVRVVRDGCRLVPRLMRFTCGCPVGHSLKINCTLIKPYTLVFIKVTLEITCDFGSPSKAAMRSDTILSNWTSNSIIISRCRGGRIPAWPAAAHPSEQPTSSPPLSKPPTSSFLSHKFTTLTAQSPWFTKAGAQAPHEITRRLRELQVATGQGAHAVRSALPFSPPCAFLRSHYPWVNHKQDFAYAASPAPDEMIVTHRGSFCFLVCFACTRVANMRHYEDGGRDLILTPFRAVRRGQTDVLEMRGVRRRVRLQRRRGATARGGRGGVRARARRASHGRSDRAPDATQRAHLGHAGPAATPARQRGGVPADGGGSGAAAPVRRTHGADGGHGGDGGDVPATHRGAVRRACRLDARRADAGADARPGDGGGGGGARQGAAHEGELPLVPRDGAGERHAGPAGAGRGQGRAVGGGGAAELRVDGGDGGAHAGAGVAAGGAGADGPAVAAHGDGQARGVDADGPAAGGERVAAGAAGGDGAAGPAGGGRAGAGAGRAPPLPHEAGRRGRVGGDVGRPVPHGALDPAAAARGAVHVRDHHVLPVLAGPHGPGVQGAAAAPRRQSAAAAQLVVREAVGLSGVVAAAPGAAGVREHLPVPPATPRQRRGGAPDAGLPAHGVRAGGGDDGGVMGGASDWHSSSMSTGSDGRGSVEARQANPTSPYPQPTRSEGMARRRES
nr:hypothetical protein CFP56_04525 [Quercus suber]